MSFRKHIACALVTVVTFSACTPSQKRDSGIKTTVNASEIMNDSSLNPEQKAEKLALAAEQLATAQSFMYADEVASQALTVNPGNIRAQLIKRLVAPMMTLKGAMTRIAPIAKRTADSRARYEKALADLDKWPDSAVKTFLTEGQEDIRNEKEAQDLLGRVEGAFDNLRTWIRDNKKTEIELNIPGEFTQAAIRDAANKCVARAIRSGVYEIECDVKRALKIKLNPADMEALQHLVAGYQIYVGTYNTYDLSGSISVADKYRGQSGQRDRIIADLLKTKEFGTLRAGNTLQKITAMGLDALQGYRYAQGLQAELCPNGQEQAELREGFLFSRGICVDQDSKVISQDPSSPYQTVGAVLRVVEAALRGSSIDFTFAGRMGTIDTEIKPSAFLNSPIADVRSLMPVRYDSCGKVIGTKDNTLGGVFVRGDANAVLLLSKDSCNQYPAYYR